MSNIIFVEAELNERDRDRASNKTETIYAVRKKEIKDSDETNDNEANNTNA